MTITACITPLIGPQPKRAWRGMTDLLKALTTVTNAAGRTRSCEFNPLANTPTSQGQVREYGAITLYLSDALALFGQPGLHKTKFEWKISSQAQ
jgi:signal recognition particle receptor subunit beta